MRRTSAAILVALATMAILAGCGGSSGGSGVSAATYVKSICGAVGPFEKDVAARSSALSNLSSLSNASQGKKALQGFLTALVSDTDQAVSKLKAAGTPNVKNGKQIAASLVKAFGQLKAAMQKAQSSAGSLPTSSADAFKSAAQGLGTSVQTSMSSIGSSLSTLKSPELEKAAAKDPTCKSLSSG
jgi:hypothetical protein